MVPKKGLEPPHPCGYMDLNHARLPIPPLRRQIPGGDLGIARQETTEINIFTGVLPVVKPPIPLTGTRTIAPNSSSPPHLLDSEATKIA
jgi:hypothetical protein